ncbi:Catenin-beta-like protein [Lipomyces tetrasporus]|uniref:Catenin-beta-like protein n=1 Tax=Lipomyces tetrasporus TaxID=54092 RepID=A0AAD7QYT4_9ASCO|nr:Catenin-beta-like protein [Lipomyces tetrasporus]KAJ8103476.1 Catenin-beta-like protein [Lipomyces tetrasporus]
MTDINSIFNSQKSEGSATKKRRLDDLSNLVKRYKGGLDDEPSGTGSPHGRNDLDGGDASPDLLLDEPLQDDEGGRFFGGGLTDEQREVLDYVDNYEDQVEDEKYDDGWVRRQIAKLNRLMHRNAQLRAKFYDKPQKFLESEEELDRAIKSLSVLTEHSKLYPSFVEHDGMKIFGDLFAHENSDIVIDAVQVLEELTDEDTQAEDVDLKALLSGAIDAGLLDTLITNITRLDDSRRVRASEEKEPEEDQDEEPERAGVFQILNVIENFTVYQETADVLFIDNSSKRQSGDTGLLPWLLQRLLVKEKPVSQNKQYAAEVLSIILQKSRLSRIHFCQQEYNNKDVGELSGVDVLLRILAGYRHFDPPVEEPEEMEMFENVFDSLAIVVQDPAGKDKLLEYEGIDLLLLFVKSGGKRGKVRAVKVLDYALSSGSSSQLATDFVNNDGLPLVFKLFVSSRFADAKNYRSATRDKNSTSHVSLDAILGIVASLFRNLPDSSPQKVKLLARFVEKNFEKLDRLLLFRDFTIERIDRLDIVNGAERAAFMKTRPQRNEDLEDWEAELEARDAEWYIQRLENGLFRLQLIDTIVTWLVAEDDEGDLGIKSNIVKKLAETKSSLDDIKKTLEGYRRDILPKTPTTAEGDIGSESEEEREQRQEATDLADMLAVLIEFL